MVTMDTRVNVCLSVLLNQVVFCLLFVGEFDVDCDHQALILVLTPPQPPPIILWGSRVEGFWIEGFGRV